MVHGDLYAICHTQKIVDPGKMKHGCWGCLAGLARTLSLNIFIIHHSVYRFKRVWFDEFVTSSDRE